MEKTKKDVNDVRIDTSRKYYDIDYYYPYLLSYSDGRVYYASCSPTSLFKSQPIMMEYTDDFNLWLDGFEKQNTTFDRYYFLNHLKGIKFLPIKKDDD